MIRRLAALARRADDGQRLLTATALAGIDVRTACERILDPPRQPGIGRPGVTLAQHLAERGRALSEDL